MNAFRPSKIQSFVWTTAILLAGVVALAPVAGQGERGDPSGLGGGGWSGGGGNNSGGVDATLAQCQKTDPDAKTKICQAALEYLKSPSASNCAQAWTFYQTAIGELANFCSAAAMPPDGSAKSPDQTRQTAALKTCMRNARDCIEQEDELDNEMSSGGLGSSVATADLDTSCNTTATTSAEDLKTEGKDLQNQMKDLQAQQVTNAKAASDALSDDQKNLMTLQNDDQNKLQGFRKQREGIANDWSQTLATTNAKKAAAVSAANANYLQADQQLQKDNLNYLAAQAQYRAAVRKARADCEAEAQQTMAKLEQQREQAIQTFTNNVGSLSNLNQSVNKFTSNYAESLNACLAGDGARAISSASDAMAVAQAAYNQSKLSLQNQEAMLEKQLQSDESGLDAQTQTDYQKMQANLASIDSDQALELQQYSGAVQQAQAASQRRIQNEQLQAMQLQQQIAKLNSEIQTNAARLAQTGVQNPGAASSKSADKKLVRAETAASKIAIYSAAYCAVIRCNSASATTGNAAQASLPPGPPPPGGCQFGQGGAGGPNETGGQPTLNPSAVPTSK